MIESRYWRQALRTEIASLRQGRQFRRWSERQQVLFERGLMLVACQIRVLLERNQVSSKASKLRLTGRQYRKRGSHPVTRLNAVALNENFALNDPEAIELPVRELCNQLLHHYVLFAVRGERRRFEVLLVFSDYKRNTCLYEFAIEEVLALFAAFASEASAPYNDPGYTLRWDGKRQDYVWETSQ